MASEDLQPGDRVQLKSGGPVMTIDQPDEGGWWCVWFDDKGIQKGLRALSPQRGQVPRYDFVHARPVGRAALTEWAGQPKVLMKVLMDLSGAGKAKSPQACNCLRALSFM